MSGRITFATLGTLGLMFMVIGVRDGRCVQLFNTWVCSFTGDPSNIMMAKNPLVLGNDAMYLVLIAIAVLSWLVIYNLVPQQKRGKVEEILPTNPSIARKHEERRVVPSGKRVTKMAPRDFAVVESNEGVILRRKPSSAAEEVDLIPQGKVVRIVQGPLLAEGFRWWKVSWGYIEGWTQDGDEQGMNRSFIPE